MSDGVITSVSSASVVQDEAAECLDRGDCMMTQNKELTTDWDNERYSPTGLLYCCESCVSIIQYAP